MAQGRQTFTQEDIEANNIADILKIKALTHYRNNGASSDEKYQCDFLIIRLNATIAGRSKTEKQHGTITSVFKPKPNPMVAAK